MKRRRIKLHVQFLLTFLPLIAGCRPPVHSPASHHLASQSSYNYPSLFYTAEDRHRLLLAATGDANASSWTYRPKQKIPGAGELAWGLGWGWTVGDKQEELNSGPNAFENRRATLLLRKAILVWLNPQNRRPQEVIQDESVQTYADLLRRAVDNFPEATGLTRSGANIQLNGKTGPWPRILEAGITCADYAKANDLLLIPQVRSAIGENHIRGYYEKQADGVLHLLAMHLRTLEKSNPTTWNNWTALELSGAGLLAMSWREYFLEEPSASPRAQDYDYLTSEVPKRLNAYLEQWKESGPENYYYEGPHYLTYFGVETAAYIHAYLQLYGPSRAYPALSFDEAQPLTKFALGQGALLVPVLNERGAVDWTNIDFDDSWYNEIGPLQLLLAAWTKHSDPQLASRLIQIAAYVSPPKGLASDLTLATSIQEDVVEAKRRLIPLNRCQTISDDVALARTGSDLQEQNLTVALKNTLTPLVGNTGVPSLGGHSHSDSGDIAIYFGDEPITPIPGYGDSGAFAKDRSRLYTSWLHKNVIEVLDPSGGYDEKVLAALGEQPQTDPFVMPLRVSGSDPKTSATEDKDGLGHYWVLSTRMTDINSRPLVHRTVILDDTKKFVLVVDQLIRPHRIRVQWNGNGFEGNATCSYSAAGNTTTAIFSNGTTLDTQIAVTSASSMQVSGLTGKYNPSWRDLKYPITTVRSVSDANVSYAVSLIQFGPKRSTFELSATPTTDSAGQLSGVTIFRSGKALYSISIGPDGQVSRNW